LLKMVDDLKAANATLIRKIENEEYELAKNSVDENQLTEKMQIIAELREEQSEREAEIAALQESNEEVNKNLTASRFQTMAQRKIAETLRSQIEETRDAINKLEKDLADAHAEVHKRQTKLEELDETKSEISTELTIAKNELSMLSERLRTQDEKEKSNEQKIAALQAQVSMANQASEKEANVALQKLQDLNETLETQLNDNRLKSDSQQETIHALEEKILLLDEEKGRLQKSLDEFIETLSREQAAHQQSRFTLDNENAELRERIHELENLVEDLELMNEKNAQRFQMQMRQREVTIQNLQRQLQVVKSEALSADAAKEQILNSRQNEFKKKLTQRERILLQEKEEEVLAAEESGRKKLFDLTTANDYLEKFNRQQVKMLEEADHAYAESLYEQEKREQEMRIKEMAEIAKRDEQMARELAEKLECQEKERMARNTQLKISPDRSIRSSSVEPQPTLTKMATARKKKMATHVDLGEQIKLHNGVKGQVRFVGIVHWTNQEMVGIELIDGDVGDTDGSRDGKTYFKCHKKGGMFITYPQISHVYRKRAKDGKLEKCRFSRNEEVANLSFDEPDSPVRPSYTRKQLVSMSTEAQIQLAMKMSVGGSNSLYKGEFVDPDAWSPMTSDDLKAESEKKKSKYKKKEKDRLMRHASVHILNGILDTIEDENVQQQVFDEFVRDRKASGAKEKKGALKENRRSTSAVLKGLGLIE